MTTRFVSPAHPGESISSDTSNGCPTDAEAAWQTWQAFEEEDTQSTQSAHMDVTADPQNQRNLLLSQEALAGRTAGLETVILLVVFFLNVP